VLHYVAILVRGDDAEWRAYLPDFRGCRAEGPSPEEAIERAKVLASHAINGSNTGFGKPLPRTLIEIRSDPAWALHRNISWQNAIVVMVEL
jgi:predicted RNase H-like HicB family nuclease